jgi:hypothetical protein
MPEHVSPRGAHVELSIALVEFTLSVMVVVFLLATLATTTDEGRTSTVAHGSISVHGQASHVEMGVVIEDNFSFQNFDNYLTSSDRRFTAHFELGLRGSKVEAEITRVMRDSQAVHLSVVEDQLFVGHIDEVLFEA